MSAELTNRLFELLKNREVLDADAFCRRLLGEILRWPIPDIPLDEFAYAWTPDELGLNGDARELAANVRQLPNLTPNQPWGVFIVEMRGDGLFRRERGLAGILRRMLGKLVAGKSKPGDQPSWRREELLFIVTHAYQDFRFAYFKAPREGMKSPSLAAFGWNRGDTHIRTLCEMNLPALVFPDNAADAAKWIEKWAAAFDVAAVTRKFFQDYSACFLELEGDVKIKGPHGDDAKRLYVQRLMNRLMFIYFIQRKGWLVFDGKTNYLRALFDASREAGDDFLRDRLMELFFHGLNHNQAGDDAVAREARERRIGQVPYLNGGLFSRAGDGLDEAGRVRINRRSFQRILELFERFNFTISESTPLEIEVAVDPEMLGKVFEELVTGRHDSGSYYTPRNVVSFMCREAMKGYLSRAAGIAVAAAEKLVDARDASDVSVAEARKVLDALDRLKAVDPACGSGAYLLGLMHELVDIYQSLFNKRLRKDSRSLYATKVKIIGHNLYGVDKDPFAVDIARLRLWLSLAVESDEPLPLPNLDFKIEVGDSLLAPDPTDKADSDLFRLERVEAFDRLKDKFLRETDADRRAGIHGEIAALRRELKTIDTFGGFDWRLEFGEVFTRADYYVSHDNKLFPGEPGNKQGGLFARPVQTRAGGFDIVLANPPYVRQELLREMKPALKTAYGDSVYAGTADLYCYFYARGVQLLRPGGMLAFISSNKWFKADYGARLRQWISSHAGILKIVDFGELPIFQTASTFPMIFIARKMEDAKPSTSVVPTIFVEPKDLNPPYPDIKAVMAEKGLALPADSLSGEDWSFVDGAARERFEKMRRNGVPLGEYVDGKIYYGIKTGCNEAFVIDGGTRERLIREDRRSAEIIKPMLAGRDIRRWRMEDRGRWLIATRIGVDMNRYPAVFRHLSQYQGRLEKRTDQGEHWWELRACAYYDEFEKPKIFYPEISMDSRFYFSKTAYYPLKTVFTISTSDLYLYGIIASQPVWEFLKSSCSVLGDPNVGGRLLLQSIYTSQIPIPNATQKDKAAIERLVKQCLDKRGVDCAAAEAEMNAVVGRLYGLWG